MHKYAVIVAGGKGERMGNEIPKQFLEIAGKPILMHTIQKFKETFSEIEIILVLPNNQTDYWEVLCKKHSFFNYVDRIVEGGKTRFHSVKNALATIKKEGVVAIHDGVRPFVSSDTIKNCFEEAKKIGNAIPVVEVVDSLRFVSKKEGTNNAVTRSCYKSVQTPQCYHSDIILKAYQQEFDAAFTDDASVVENLGRTIHLVKGNVENIKITNQMDLILAEGILSKHLV